MKQINWYIGLFLIFIFIITGLYIQYLSIPEDAHPHVYRMILRANHVYILFIGMVNIVLSRSNYTSPRIEWMSRVFYIISAPLVLLAFMWETGGDMENRLISFNAVLLAFMGLILFILDVIFYPKQPKADS
ncbi:MAG: hypothetical protein ACON42_06065 [Flavobacteriaceae bacterium]